MTKDEIISMAREAEFEIEETLYGLAPCVDGRVIRCNLERFAALVAAAEREACAKMCDFEVARLTAIDEQRPALAAGICAAAIRARGEK